MPASSGSSAALAVPARPHYSGSRNGGSSDDGSHDSDSDRVLHDSDSAAELDAFFEVALTDPDFVSFSDQVTELIRRRHTANTRRNYDYWVSRFDRWLAQPESRFRFRSAPPVSLSSVLPIDARVENMVVTWLTDLYMGPTDPSEREDWLTSSGPVAPATFSQVLSALKARSSEFGNLPWTPSTGFKNWAEGMRRRLADAHGPEVQAEPLLAHHVTAIAEHLHGFVSPSHLRDGLVFELAALGLNPGEIANLDLSSLSFRPRDSSASHAGWALLVPGRRRRNGRQDRPRLVEVPAGSPAEAALSTYLGFRLKIAPDTLTPAVISEALASGGVDTFAGGFLVEATGSNRRAHVRQILLRLADLASVAWQPTDGPPSHSETASMRAVLVDALDWPGQIGARRDHVMLLVGYGLALRRSELCALRLRDVSFQEGGAKVNIVRSKTDQIGKGKLLPISAQRHPKPATDTVGLLHAWCDLLRSAGASGDTPLFPAFDRWGHVLSRRSSADGQLRTYSTMAPQSWSDRLNSLAREATVFELLSPGESPVSAEELDERYGRVSGHSLRRGFVTTALLAGVDPIKVAKQTRHSNVDMIMLYADELRLLEGFNWSEIIFGDPLGGEFSSYRSSAVEAEDP